MSEPKSESVMSEPVKDEPASAPVASPSVASAPVASASVASAPAAEPVADKPEAAKLVDGDEAKAKPDGDGKKPSKRRSGDLRIELELSRQRSLVWTIAGGVIGGLLIWKLGTVGVWGGVLLVVIAAYHAWLLIQTFLYPPGTFVVTEREVSLPRGLCVPRPVQAARKDVTAVYFLRRSVPWNQSSPVLVVELGDKAMLFPRDWFASEADQRHIVHALLRDKPVPAAAAAPNEPAA